MSENSANSNPSQNNFNPWRLMQSGYQVQPTISATPFPCSAMDMAVFQQQFQNFFLLGTQENLLNPFSGLVPMQVPCQSIQQINHEVPSTRPSFDAPQVSPLFQITESSVPSRVSLAPPLFRATNTMVPPCTVFGLAGNQYALPTQCFQYQHSMFGVPRTPAQPRAADSSTTLQSRQLAQKTQNEMSSTQSLLDARRCNLSPLFQIPETPGLRTTATESSQNAPPNSFETGPWNLLQQNAVNHQIPERDAPAQPRAADSSTTLQPRQLAQKTHNEVPSKKSSLGARRRNLSPLFQIPETPVLRTTATESSQNAPPNSFEAGPGNLLQQKAVNHQIPQREAPAPPRAPFAPSLIHLDDKRVPSSTFFGFATKQDEPSSHTSLLHPLLQRDIALRHQLMSQGETTAQPRAADSSTTLQSRQLAQKTQNEMSSTQSLLDARRCNLSPLFQIPETPGLRTTATESSQNAPPNSFETGPGNLLQQNAVNHQIPERDAPAQPRAADSSTTLQPRQLAQKTHNEVPSKKSSLGARRRNLSPLFQIPETPVLRTTATESSQNAPPNSFEAGPGNLLQQKAVNHQIPQRDAPAPPRAPFAPSLIHLDDKRVPSSTFFGFATKQDEPSSHTSLLHPLLQRDIALRHQLMSQGETTAQPRAADSSTTLQSRQLAQKTQNEMSSTQSLLDARRCNLSPLFQIPETPGLRTTATESSQNAPPNSFETGPGNLLQQNAVNHQIPERDAPAQPRAADSSTTLQPRQLAQKTHNEMPSKKSSLGARRRNLSPLFQIPETPVLRTTATESSQNAPPNSFEAGPGNLLQQKAVNHQIPQREAPAPPRAPFAPSLIHLDDKRVPSSTFFGFATKQDEPSSHTSLLHPLLQRDIALRHQLMSQGETTAQPRAADSSTTLQSRQLAQKTQNEMSSTQSLLDARRCNLSPLFQIPETPGLRTTATESSQNAPPNSFETGPGNLLQQNAVNHQIPERDAPAQPRAADSSTTLQPRQLAQKTHNEMPSKKSSLGARRRNLSPLFQIPETPVLRTTATESSQNAPPNSFEAGPGNLLQQKAVNHQIPQREAPAPPRAPFAPSLIHLDDKRVPSSTFFGFATKQDEPSSHTSLLHPLLQRDIALRHQLMSQGETTAQPRAADSSTTLQSRQLAQKTQNEMSSTQSLLDARRCNLSPLFQIPETPGLRTTATESSQNAPPNSFETGPGNLLQQNAVNHQIPERDAPAQPRAADSSTTLQPRQLAQKTHNEMPSKKSSLGARRRNLSPLFQIPETPVLRTTATESSQNAPPNSFEAGPGNLLQQKAVNHQIPQREAPAPPRAPFAPSLIHLDDKRVPSSTFFGFATKQDEPSSHTSLLHPLLQRDIALRHQLMSQGETTAQPRAADSSTTLQSRQLAQKTQNEMSSTQSLLDARRCNLSPLFQIPETPGLRTTATESSQNAPPNSFETGPGNLLQQNAVNHQIPERDAPAQPRAADSSTTLQPRQLAQKTHNEVPSKKSSLGARRRNLSPLFQIPETPVLRTTATESSQNAPPNSFEAGPGNLLQQNAVNHQIPQREAPQFGGTKQPWSVQHDRAALNHTLDLGALGTQHNGLQAAENFLSTAPENLLRRYDAQRADLHRNKQTTTSTIIDDSATNQTETLSLVIPATAFDDTANETPQLSTMPPQRTHEIKEELVNANKRTTNERQISSSEDNQKIIYHFIGNALYDFAHAFVKSPEAASDKPGLTDTTFERMSNKISFEPEVSDKVKEEPVDPDECPTNEHSSCRNKYLDQVKHYPNANNFVVTSEDDHFTIMAVDPRAVPDCPVSKQSPSKNTSDEIKEETVESGEKPESKAAITDDVDEKASCADTTTPRRKRRQTKKQRKRCDSEESEYKPSTSRIPVITLDPPRTRAFYRRTGAVFVEESYTPPPRKLRKCKSETE